MTRSREELAHEVVMLAQQGMSERAIARALHVGRNRVQKLLRAHEAARNGATPPTALPPPPASRPSMLDAHEAFIRDLLARFPDITARRVYEELCARQDIAFNGPYTIVKKYVRALRPKPVVEVSTPVDEPGGRSPPRLVLKRCRLAGCPDSRRTCCAPDKADKQHSCCPQGLTSVRGRSASEELERVDHLATSRDPGVGDDRLDLIAREHRFVAPLGILVDERPELAAITKAQLDTDTAYGGKLLAGQRAMC